MPRISKPPRYDKTFSVSTSGTLENTGIDTSKITRFESGFCGQNGDYINQYYYDANDMARCWIGGSNGTLTCQLGSNWPKKPCSVRIRIWYDD